MNQHSRHARRAAAHRRRLRDPRTDLRGHGPIWHIMGAAYRQGARFVWVTTAPGRIDLLVERMSDASIARLQIWAYLNRPLGLDVTIRRGSP